MSTSLTTTLYNRLPNPLARLLIGNKLTRRFAQRFVRGQDVVIQTGVGKGLWINCDRSNSAYGLGDNEMVVQRVFESQLQPGDVLFDVGANIGFFTVISAKLVGPQGHVYAFEPLPDNFSALSHNIALNDFSNVTLINSAVADESGQGELLVAYYSGGSSLSTVATPPPDLKESMVVQTVAVDDFLADGSKRRPKMVKIDVEGAELTVMRGMVETIRRDHPVILYEIDDADSAEYERKAKECADFLIGFGYRITPITGSYQDIDWHVGHFLAVKGDGPEG
ncbi:MAG: FkbM family methyltransferase [Candidatus Promineifilaceae bacterium]